MKMGNSACIKCKIDFTKYPVKPPHFTLQHFHTILSPLVDEQNDKQVLQDHCVRYQDSYVKQDGKWLMSKHIANFMISESREIGESTKEGSGRILKAFYKLQNFL